MSIELPKEAYLLTPSGTRVDLANGDRLVFGRGTDADVQVAAHRGLSRRAGVVTAAGGGVWIANISRTHTLYVESAAQRIRLPRLEGGDEPAGGWFVWAGSVHIGSRSMLDDGWFLRLVVARADVPWAEDEDTWGSERTGEDTLLPLRLDPNTKLFLVAALWCRPWLVNPARTTPLPRTPEIARAVLEAVGAYAELARFDADSAFRNRSAARISEHLKVLRRRIVERGLVPRDARLSDEVVVEVLIEHAVITAEDLNLLADPAWLSRQENLWWDGDT